VTTPRQRRAGRVAAAGRWLRARLAATPGSMTVLTTGVLVVVLMVIGVGTSITGVHLERNALQHAADSAALAASQAVDEHALYTKGEGPLVLPASARAAAEQHLRDYPPSSGRTVDIHVTSVSTAGDGTVHVVVAAATHPPLAGWFTRGTGIAVPLTVEGEARAR